MPEVSGRILMRYFEGDEYVGERGLITGACRYDDKTWSGYWPNVAYFCPTCGLTWAREIRTPLFDYRPIPEAVWAIEIRRCVKHGDGYLLTGLTDSALADCTLGLLKREALLLCINHKE
jgi:hypothetical protein